MYQYSVDNLGLFFHTDSIDTWQFIGCISHLVGTPTDRAGTSELPVWTGTHGERSFVGRIPQNRLNVNGLLERARPT